MRFLIQNRQQQKYGRYYRPKRTRHLRKTLVRFSIVLAIAYCLTFVFLYFRQNNIIYKPNRNISASSIGNRHQLNYQNVWIGVPNSKARIHGWWFDAPSAKQPVTAIPNEPVNILTTPKTMLYLGDRSGKKNYSKLERIIAFQQLGFSVLAIDYRGYGKSEGRLPNETRLYEDSRAAWQYLTSTRQISPQDIVIYGESLGGAVAIDLAVKQPDAAGLIVQSSFTSMPEQIKQSRPGLKIFPLNFIVHQRFNSIEKVRSLAMPVLFIHGVNDTVVDYRMSRQLYYVAPEPKKLFFVQGGEHLHLYKPGKYSYLRAIKDFMSQIS